MSATAEDFQTFEIERLARAVLAQLAPLTGTRATGTALVRRAAGFSGVVELPRNAYAIPVTYSQAHPQEYANSLVKVAANPATARPFERCGQWEIGDDPVEVSFVTNVGGLRHGANLKPGDRLRFDPPIEGLEPEAEVTVAWAPGVDGLFLSATVADELNVPLDFVKANLSRMPGVAVSWVGSAPVEGVTAGLRQGASRKSRTVQLYYESFVVTIFTAMSADLHSRRRVGKALMEAVSNALTGVKVNADGEGISDVDGTGVEITARQLVFETPQMNAYAVAFRVVSSLERVDVRTFAPWLRTKIEASLPRDAAHVDPYYMVARGPGPGAEEVGILVEHGADAEEVELWVMDNSPYPSGASPDGSNGFELWGWSSQILDGSGHYTGPPTRHIRGPFDGTNGAGRGHGFCVLDEANHPDWEFVVATSEDHTGNGRESWWLVPRGANGQLTLAECPRIRCNQLFAGTAHANYGARHAVNWGGGVIIIGSTGVWKPVTTAAWFLSDEELAALPRWYYNGNLGGTGIGTYDYARLPGTDLLVVNGDDRVFALDLSLPTTSSLTALTHTGLNVPGPGSDGLTWIMMGDNIGRPSSEGWRGFIAFDAAGNIWKQRAVSRDISRWPASTFATLPHNGNGDYPGANPAPDLSLTSPTFDELDIENVQACYTGLDFDSAGRLWTLVRSYDGFANGSQVYTPAKAYRFSAEGGSQMPDLILDMPPLSQPFMMRLAPGHALHRR